MSEERWDILAITAQTEPEKPISEHDHTRFIKIDQLILACNNLEWCSVSHDFIMADARGETFYNKKQWWVQTNKSTRKTELGGLIDLS